MTVAYVGIVISAVISAVSAAQQSQAAKDQRNYQAAVSRNNAKIAEYQRSIVIQDADIAATKRTREAADLSARQRVAIAANNLALDEGSPLDILATTEFYKQEDVVSIQSDAARKAWGYEVEGANLTNDANFNKRLADKESPGKAAAIAGASSLLSSASSYAAKR